jgi:uncharacterized protein YjbK
MNVVNNNQEVELEAKNLLSKTDFATLKDFFKIEPGSFIQQTNKYFMDQENKLLVQPAGTTLRLRTKKGKMVLEFKFPQADGSTLEYATPISDQEYESLMDNGDIPTGAVNNALISLGITSKISFLGIANTLRSEAIINNTWGVEIVLDKTHYPGGKTDYEIEIESDDLQKSQDVLKELMTKFAIPIVSTPRKIERFYEAIKQ